MKNWLNCLKSKRQEYKNRKIEKLLNAHEIHTDSMLSILRIKSEFSDKKCKILNFIALDAKK